MIVFVEFLRTAFAGVSFKSYHAALKTFSFRTGLKPDIAAEKAAGFAKWIIAGHFSKISPIIFAQIIVLPAAITYTVHSFAIIGIVIKSG